VGAHDVERLGADRTGRAEQHHAAGVRSRRFLTQRQELVDPLGGADGGRQAAAGTEV
jgi:hypothetical protein